MVMNNIPFFHSWPLPYKSIAYRFSFVTQMASFVTQTPIGDPKHAPWNNVVKHIDHLLTSLSVWVTNSQNTRDLVTQLSHLEHSLSTPTSYTAFVSFCVFKLKELRHVRDRTNERRTRSARPADRARGSSSISMGLWVRSWQPKPNPRWLHRN